MQNRVNQTNRKPPGKSGGEAQLFVLSWSIGLLSGMAASAIAVMVAIAMGYLSLGVEVASAQEPQSGAATTMADTLTAGTVQPMIMLGPTSTADLLSTPTPMSTGLATWTPNYAATATQACYLFHSNMPGTPCPRYSTPTPVP
jgi:hypothetical protein